MNKSDKPANKKTVDNLLPVKASIAFLVANIAEKGIALITTPIFTRLLTTGEYGEITAFSSWMSLLGVVAMFCLSQGVFNNGMLEYPNNRNEFISSMLVLSNIISIITMAVVGLVMLLFPSVININGSMFILLLCVFILQPAFSFWKTRQRYEFKYRASTIVTIVASGLAQFVAIGAICLFPTSKVTAKLWGMYGTLLLVYLFFYILQMMRSKQKVNMHYIKFSFLFNAPLIPHYFSTYILSNFDRVMIADIVSDSAAGLYGLAYSIASVVIIIWSAINNSLIPITYESLKSGTFENTKKHIRTLMLIYALGCCFIMLLGPELIRLLGTEEYSDAMYCIPPIVAGTFFIAIYSIYANCLYYIKKPKYVMFASLVSAVLNVVLNLIFIPLYGFIAAAYTTMFCYVLQAALDMIASRRAIKGEIYEIRSIAICSALIIALGSSAHLIYSLSIIRYILAGVAAIITMSLVLNNLKLLLNKV